MAKAKTTDDIVMELLKKVKQKKDEIASAKKKPGWKTNCSISFESISTRKRSDPVQDRVNIQVERNTRKLTELYVMLLQMEEYHAKATTELGFPEDLTFLAYPIMDWKADLKTRAVQLSIDAKQEEVKALDKRVNSIVSPEQRRAMEIKALTELLAV